MFDPVGEFLGWMMVVAALIPIPAYMIFFVLRRAKGTLIEVNLNPVFFSKSLVCTLATVIKKEIENT